MVMPASEQGAETNEPYADGMTIKRDKGNDLSVTLVMGLACVSRFG